MRSHNCVFHLNIRIVQGPDPLINPCSFSSSHLLGQPGVVGFSPSATQAAQSSGVRIPGKQYGVHWGSNSGQEMKAAT